MTKVNSMISTFFRLQRNFLIGALARKGTTYYSEETETRMFAPSPAAQCPQTPMPTG